MTGRLSEASVECGHCGGPIFMLTCHHARGTEHDWALAGICVSCRTISWGSGCLDCRRCTVCGGRGRRSSWINELGREIEGECPDCNGTGVL